MSLRPNPSLYYASQAMSMKAETDRIDGNAQRSLLDEGDGASKRYADGSSMSTIKYLLIAVMITVVLGLVLSVGFGAGLISIFYGMEATECSDNNPCTKDIRLNDNTCENRLYPLGKKCGTSCFASGSGLCTAGGVCASPPDSCSGSCSSMVYDVPTGMAECPVVRVSNLETGLVEDTMRACVAKGCFYSFEPTGPFTGHCLRYVQNRALVADECLSVYYDPDTTTCFISYQCAVDAAHHDVSSTAIEALIVAGAFAPSERAFISPASLDFSSRISEDSASAYALLISDAVRRSIHRAANPALKISPLTNVTQLRNGAEKEADYAK